MLSSRERIANALNHVETDRIPLDLGGTVVSGMHASSVYLLRQALQLDPSGTPVKVIDPYQMLGEIQPDLQAALGIDTVRLQSRTTLFGFEAADWKPWTLFDGTPVLVPGGFNTEPEENGDILMYPEGDRSARASARMPAGGYYFDEIDRQETLDESRLNPEDNMEEFVLVDDETLRHFRQESERLYTETDKAIVLTIPGASFGDIALVPAPWLKDPKGIRGVEAWYMSAVQRPDYVIKVFERQCEVALRNLELIYEAAGDRVQVIFYAGADFGMQTGCLISPKAYRSLYKPFHKELNDWIHKHTPWRVFLHSCGSVIALLPDFIEAGFDILNPVQCSAAGMEAHPLKARFGDQVVFWGGGVDTQRTLPFGAPEEVRAEVRERIRAFAPGGGFVFNTIHNVQARVPVANLLAMYGAVRENEH